MSLWDIIATPFAWLLLQLYYLTHNYGVALILFGVVVKLVLLFFAAKGKESMLKQQRLQPRVKELEKKYSGNTRKYQEEVQKLYREEKIKPLSGCLWSLIPFPILLALYRVIRFPLSLLMGLNKGEVEMVKTTLEGLGANVASSGAYAQMSLAQEVHRHFAEVSAVVPKVKDINFNFLGINLAEVPNWKIFTALKNASPEAKTAIILLFLIPIISGIFAFVQMYVTQKLMKAPETDEATPNPMGSGKTMTFIMPLISVWFGFIMPAGISIYWITQSVFGTVQEVALTKYYNKKLDALDADRLERERKQNEENERKRAETERLRAENATVVNPNTSKKKLQASEKQQQREKANEWEAERERARALEKGIAPAAESGAVGDRPFARGRNYDPSRYTERRVPPAAAAEPAQDPEAETDVSSDDGQE